VEAINEILVADTDSESGAEDGDFEHEFEDCEDGQEQASTQQDKAQAATSDGASPTWRPPEGRNINIHPFCWSSKRFEKQSGSTHQQRQLTTVCVDAAFHTKFSAAGGTDELVLPATL
jgi:hypothetical protein